MKRVKTSGPKRMRELGYKSIQFFLSPAQIAALKKVAEEVGIPVATLARRAVNYFVGGGAKFTENLLRSRHSNRYD